MTELDAEGGAIDRARVAYFAQIRSLWADLTRCIHALDGMAKRGLSAGLEYDETEKYRVTFAEWVRSWSAPRICTLRSRRKRDLTTLGMEWGTLAG
jgi:hypothetical protein